MKPVNVLLVEDNPADVELVREALDFARLEHNLHLAVDFEEAKSQINNIRAGAISPDILLMDLNLPKGGGLDLLRLFRTNPECQTLPVIVVSSSNTLRDRESAAQLGALYFRKPIDLEEFMKLGDMVLELLNRESATGL